jgi:hypothetical protein
LRSRRAILKAAAREGRPSRSISVAEEPSPCNNPQKEVFDDHARDTGTSARHRPLDSAAGV